MTAITLDDPSAYFDRLAAFERDHWWSVALWRISSRWLDRTIGGRSGLNAIDVGCGAGLNLDRLAGRPEIDRVVGVDPSPEALTYARRQSSARLALGSAANLPFESACFDVATCFDVVQHMTDRDRSQAAAEIARVLRPGGVAVVRSNAGGGDGVGLDRLRSMFEVDGLRVIQATYANAFGSVVQECRGRLTPSRARPHPGGGGLPSVRRSRIDGVMAGVGRVEAYWAGRLGRSLPWGHSTMLLAVKSETGL